MADETSLQKRESEAIEPERMRQGPVFVPHVDIVEEDDKLLVRADMPGVKTQDLDIHYEQGMLTIYGRVVPRQDPEKIRPVLREYDVGDFYRSFRIGEGIDSERITADLRHGVLTLHLPKSEEARPRRIEVKAF